MSLEQLLADTALTDDLEITLGSQKVKVGDLRAYAKAKADATAAAERASEVKRKEYEDAKAKAEKLAKDSLALFEESTKTITERNRKADANTGDIDWETDPVYSPIQKRLTKLEKERLEVFDTELKKVQAAVAAGFKFITEDYQDRRWSALKDAPKDKTWRDFYKVAEEQNIRDSHGLFDPVEAYNRATAADRRAAELAEAKKQGAKEAEEKMRQAQLGRPGSTPVVRQQADKNLPKFGTPEWSNAVLNDPEIQRIANGDVQ